MTNPEQTLRERLARKIAENVGPAYDEALQNKREYLNRRGEGPTDVNGPFRDDYDNAADDALSVFREWLESEATAQVFAALAVKDLEDRLPPGMTHVGATGGDVEVAQRILKALATHLGDTP